MNLNLIKDASCLDIASLILSAPTVCFDYIKKRHVQLTLKPTKHFYLQLITEYPLSEETKSLTVQKRRKESLRRLSPLSTNIIRKPFTCRLPDDSSIFTAEPGVLLLLLLLLLLFWYVCVVF